MIEIEYIEKCRYRLEQAIKTLLNDIGDIPIGESRQFPYGWRKAAKGRTVWRILEEVISQNLEKKSVELGLKNFKPASSEVGVYDFSFEFEYHKTIYVNVKSAVIGARTNKDDISKADKILDFYKSSNDVNLMILTIVIEFLETPMKIRLNNCHVMPIIWLPDIYVNPSNNGNLQSSKYKNLELSIRRTPTEFIALLEKEMDVAYSKKLVKRQPK